MIIIESKVLKGMLQDDGGLDLYRRGAALLIVIIFNRGKALGRYLCCWMAD